MKLGRMRVLASESLIYGVSAIFTRFISVFLVPVYTRLFSPEDYGILSLVTSTYAVVAVFAVLALDSASGRWFWDSELESDRKRTIATAAWSQIASAIVFGVALYFASDRLAILVVHRADTALYFRLLAITLPFAQFGTVVSGWLRLQRRPVAATVYALGTSLLQIAVTLFFVVGMHWGLKGIYSAQVLSLTVGAFAALALLKDWINPAWFDFVRLKAMLMFALPLIPSALAMWVVGFADRYFVEMFDSTSEVGLFSLGSSLAQGMFLLTGAFQMAWGPFALSIHKEPDAKRTYAQAFLAYLGVTTFIATGLSLFAPEIISMLTSKPEFGGAVSVVGMMALSYMMIGLTYIAATGPQVMKLSRPIGAAIAVSAVLNLVLNYLLVPHFGKVGAAFATLASQATSPAVLFWKAHRIYPVPYRFGAGAALVALSLALIVTGLLLPVNGIAGVLVKVLLLGLYLPLLYWLDIVTIARARSALFFLRSKVS